MVKFRGHRWKPFGNKGRHRVRCVVCRVITELPHHARPIVCYRIKEEVE